MRDFRELIRSVTIVILVSGVIIPISAIPVSPIAVSTQVNAQVNAPQLSAQERAKPLPTGKPFSFYLSRGGRLLETGSYRQALLYLEAALRAPRKGVKAALIDLANTLRLSAILYEDAQQLRQAGQWEAAVAKYETIRQVNLNDPRPLEMIIEIYDLLSEQAERAGQYQEAARLYERWAYYDPRNDFPRQNLLKMVKQLVALAEQQGEITALLAAYRRLERLQPEDNTIGEKILRLEMMRERQRTIAEALALLRPDDPASLPAAIAAIEGALSVYPDEPRLQTARRQARGWRERFQAETLM
jgi:tetratricopeptide (TPR) repeat protein